MAIPSGTGTIGKDIQYEVNFTLDYINPNTFEITINSETNPAVRQFLECMRVEENELKLLELFKKLPSICETQWGYKYQTKNVRLPARLPRNWEISKPYQSNKMTLEDLRELENVLKFHLDYGGKFEEYPVLSIVRLKARKEELAAGFIFLKDLYKLLFN